MSNAKTGMDQLTGSAAAGAVAYLAIFELRTALVEADSRMLRDSEGLLLSHVVALGAGSSQLVTYWASIDHYLSSQERIEAMLEDPPCVQGRVSQIASPPKPWWRAVKPTTLVLSAAALLGALEVLTNRYDRLFAEPQLTLKPDARFELTEGDEIRRTVTLRNQLPATGHNDVKLRASWEAQDAVGQSSQGELQLSEAFIPLLPGGDARELVIEGAAPGPGIYKMKVSASAEAGWLRGARSFVAPDVSFRVWARDLRGQVVYLNSNSVQALYALRVQIGEPAPKGLDCNLEIRGIPNLRYDARFYSPVGIYRDGNGLLTAGQEKGVVSILTWSTGPVESRREIQMELTLAGTSDTNWRDLAKDALLTCEARTEKLDEEKR